MPDPRPSLALAIPAYNEAIAIDAFLDELIRELRPATSPLTIVVVDDASTDGTTASAQSVDGVLGARIVCVRNPTNQGHGATVLRAYALALETGADLVLQVDGDGQFSGSDARRLVESISGADVAAGVRSARADAWFRRLLSRCLRVYLRVYFGTRIEDPNCPLRVYRRAVLTRLLAWLPDQPLVPNVHLSVLAAAMGCRIAEISVRHLPRRGPRAEGSTWGSHRVPLLIPSRLVRLVLRALVESSRFRPAVRRARLEGHGAPATAVSLPGPAAPLG